MGIPMRWLFYAIGLPLGGFSLNFEDEERIFIRFWIFSMIFILKPQLMLITHASHSKDGSLPF